MNTATLRIIALNIRNAQMERQKISILHDLEHADESIKHLPIYQNQYDTMMMLIDEQLDNEDAIIELEHDMEA